MVVLITFLALAVRSGNSQVENGNRKEIPRSAWRKFKEFAPLDSCNEESAMQEYDCERSKEWPLLISNSVVAKHKYKDYICVQPSYGVNPNVWIESETTVFENSCMYIPSSQDAFGMWRKAWNKTHYILIRPRGDDRSDVDLADVEANFKTLARGRSRSRRISVSGNILVIPYSHQESKYQHVMLDFLPLAYSVVEYVKAYDLRILTSTQLQSELLQRLGIPKANIMLVDMEDSGAGNVVCVGAGDQIHFLRIRDQFHRLINFRSVGKVMAKAVIQANQVHKLSDIETSSKTRGPTVVFLKRCGGNSEKPGMHAWDEVEERRAEVLGNEKEAFILVRRIMHEMHRQEELVALCSAEKDFDQQVDVLRRAKVVIGTVGGGFANLLFAKASCSTKVIEFVGDEETNQRLSQIGRTPYKSHFFGGMGSPFDYRIVLMAWDRNKEYLHIQMQDLELALKHAFKKTKERRQLEDAEKEEEELDDDLDNVLVGAKADLDDAPEEEPRVVHRREKQSISQDDEEEVEDDHDPDDFQFFEVPHTLKGGHRPDL